MKVDASSMASIGSFRRKRYFEGRVRPFVRLIPRAAVLFPLKASEQADGEEIQPALATPCCLTDRDANSPMFGSNRGGLNQFELEQLPLCVKAVIGALAFWQGGKLGGRSSASQVGIAL